MASKKANIARAREYLKNNQPEMVRKAHPELSDAIDAVLAEGKVAKPASSGCSVQRDESLRI